MPGFVKVAGPAAPMPAANVDTDVIMPKAFLKGIDRAGLAAGLFHDLRFDGEGRERPDFILNRPAMQGVRFLLTGSNFGCGSSREHAVWGMQQFGLRGLIGTTFAGIFSDNAANNGLLLISLPEDDLERLFAAVGPDGAEIEVDLEGQTIRAGAMTLAFPIEAQRRRALMEGLDRIGATLQRRDEIRAFEAAYLAEAPWFGRETAS